MIFAESRDESCSGMSNFDSEITIEVRTNNLLHNRNNKDYAALGEESQVWSLPWYSDAFIDLQHCENSPKAARMLRQLAKVQPLKLGIAKDNCKNLCLYINVMHSQGFSYLHHSYLNKIGERNIVCNIYDK